MAATNSPASASTRATDDPVILLINGTAYSLEFGLLLSCPLLASGFALEMWGAEPNWGQVENFDLEPEVQAEIDRAFSALILLDDEHTLCSEYDRWCAREGMPAKSADEQDLEAASREQRGYLRRFILRWDRAVNPRAATRGILRFSHNAWLEGRLESN